MKVVKMSVAFLMLALLSTHAAAQDAELEALARDYFGVLQTEGMTSVGQFMHPDALADFKAMLLPVFEAEADAGQRELRDLTFGFEATMADIAGLDPEAFMNGFMNIIAAQTGDVRISFDQLDVLGIVAEGDQRHVLARITVGANDIQVTQFEVLSFRPYQNTWKLQLNGEMQGLAAALSSSL